MAVTQRKTSPHKPGTSPSDQDSSTGYPKPDRSDQVRTRTKGDDGILDIGWAEGTLKDGRPYVSELWAQDQVTSMTVFISSQGIPSLDDDDSARLLEDNGLVEFGSKTYCSARQFEDAAGEPMWSINLMVGDDEDTFVRGSIPFFPYRSAGEVEHRMDARRAAPTPSCGRRSSGPRSASNSFSPRSVKRGSWRISRWPNGMSAALSAGRIHEDRAFRGSSPGRAVRVGRGGTRRKATSGDPRCPGAYRFSTS